MLSPELRPLRELILAAGGIQVAPDGQVLPLKLILLGGLFRDLGRQGKVDIP